MAQFKLKYLTENDVDFNHCCVFCRFGKYDPNITEVVCNKHRVAIAIPFGVYCDDIISK